MGILFIICLLFLIVFTLICFAVIQIKLAGMNIKYFWSFIEANQMLDKLYRFSKRYEKLGNTEQIIFLQEAEKIFNAFDKVPDILWEDEYQKYMSVLDTYKDIRLVRWAKS